MMRQFWTRRAAVTYGIVGETRRAQKEANYVRPESARNRNTNSMSFECGLKQHKNCPKKYHAHCTCLCHQKAVSPAVE